MHSFLIEKFDLDLENKFFITSLYLHEMLNKFGKISINNAFWNLKN
jgi:hypothetical protein